MLQPRTTSGTLTHPCPPSQFSDARGRRHFGKRDSLRPEDALALLHNTQLYNYSNGFGAKKSIQKRRISVNMTSTSSPTTASAMYYYQQHQTATRHESLNAVVARKRTPRQAQHTQSVPALPVVVYEGNQLGSILEEDGNSSPVSGNGKILPPPLMEKVVKIKEAVKKVVRPVDWRRLPNGVLDLVLDHLKGMHLRTRQATGCETCYMRDLCALQMTCKAWFSLAQKKLYEKIVIIGEDDKEKRKRFKMKYGVRLLLLRRTLRSKALLASLVRELHVPDPIIPLYQPNGDPNAEYDEYLCLLASLVMACPNLEVFDGFYPFYNHTFDRLTHALSTRARLKQHTWIIAENADCTLRAQKQLPPGIMDDHQTYQFLQYHDRWSQLETLLLCSPGSLGVLEHDVLISALHSLPRLKHLCISSFDADDLHDATLLALPHIVSLRLEECPGISDAGLMRWAASPNSVLVERLSLIHQNLANLVTIARILASLERLSKFTIIQSDLQPALPLDAVIFQPFFASKSLEFLHWDIVGASSSSSAAREPLRSLPDALGALPTPHPPPTPNTHLAMSILHHGFPSIRRVRAPRDMYPTGAIQSVCRPARNMSMLLPRDRTALQFPKHSKGSNHLQAARIRAQRVIDRAVTESGRGRSNEGGGGMKVVVDDYSGCSPVSGEHTGRTERAQQGFDEEDECTCPVSDDSFARATTIDAPAQAPSYETYNPSQSLPRKPLSQPVEADSPPISRFPTTTTTTSITTYGTTATTTTSYAPSSSASSTVSASSSSTGATTLADGMAQQDPNVAFGVTEDMQMKERYVVGMDWDKEVVISNPSAGKRGRIGSTAATPHLPNDVLERQHIRHVSAPAPPEMPRRLPPPPPVLVARKEVGAEIAHPRIVHSHTMGEVETAHAANHTVHEQREQREMEFISGREDRADDRGRKGWSALSKTKSREEVEIPFSSEPLELFSSISSSNSTLYPKSTSNSQSGGSSHSASRPQSYSNSTNRAINSDPSPSANSDRSTHHHRHQSLPQQGHIDLRPSAHPLQQFQTHTPPSSTSTLPPSSSSSSSINTHPFSPISPISASSSTNSAATTTQTSTPTPTPHPSSPLRVHEFSLPTVVGRVSIHIGAGGQVFTPPVFWLRGGGGGDFVDDGLTTVEDDGEGMERRRERREGNGGVVGWGELLSVRKRQVRASRATEAKKRGGESWGAEGHDEEDDGFLEGGEESFGMEGGGKWRFCDGAWNRKEGWRREKKGWVLGMGKRAEGRWRGGHVRRETGGGRGVKVQEFF